MKLTCPKCNSNNTKVISVDDRTGSKEGDHIARYWRCLDCEEKYTTRERIEKPSVCLYDYGVATILKIPNRGVLQVGLQADPVPFRRKAL